MIALHKSNDDSSEKHRAHIKNMRIRVLGKITKMNVKYDSEQWELMPIGNEWQEIEEGVSYAEPDLKYIHNDSNIVLIQALKGSIVALHKHDQKERIHVIDGMVNELYTNRVGKAGDYYDICKNEPHGIEFLEDTILVVTWKPKIK